MDAQPFYGGHYHVYLKKNNTILDIASNAYYDDNTFKIPLKGKVFKIRNFYEIEKDLQNLPENLLTYYGDKLFLLTHYYDLEYHSRKRKK